MENENPKLTLEQRVERLEAEMKELASIIYPDAKRTLGTVAVLLSAVRAAVDLLPPGSASAQLIRTRLEAASGDMYGSFADTLTLQQFDADKADLIGRLDLDPADLVRSEKANPSPDSA